MSSIVVTLRHGACMFWGGSFDPAYVMSVAALPSQLQPTTNRRNAALIQRHMEETLGVRPARGVLRFVPVAEECWVWGGRTVAGEVEELERGVGVGGGGDGADGELGLGSPVRVAVAEDGAVGRGGKGAGERKNRRMLSVKVRFSVTTYLLSSTSCTGQ